MSKKDLARGEGNRVADGQSVFDPNSDSHVERTTPLKTKMRQMKRRERTRNGSATREERESQTRQ